ncbi:hypothetical protein [Roseomonas sp. BN140053]|uniref:hypothetical protein n=1 Tax=Roseomonas sp. BN140053 TaxID=3391898 RepID=UPI0039EA315C
MDPYTRLLVLMAQWWRHPPDRTRIIVILAALAIALLIVGFEHVFGWPDWLRTNPVPIRRL